MASKNTYEYYNDDLTKMSPIRATAESIFNETNNSGHIWEPSVSELYQMACKQPGVTVTDLDIYPPAAKLLGLLPGSKVLNDNHGRIIGRNALARRFYDRVSSEDKNYLEGIVREAAYDLHQRDLITTTGVIGTDPDMMIRARFVSTATDAAKAFGEEVSKSMKQLI